MNARAKIIEGMEHAIRFVRGEDVGTRVSVFFDGQPVPPTPWDWTVSETPSANGHHHVYLVDATGRKIGALWGKGPEKEAMAKLIVYRVNGLMPGSSN